MTDTKGDPGDLNRLNDPAWLARVAGSGFVRKRPPVRVADVETKQPAKNEAARKELMARITAGTSKIGFDLSQFKVAPARANEPSAKDLVATGQALHKQYLAFLEDLSKTPAGFQLLSDLEKSGFKTQIAFDFKGDNRTINQGTGAWDGKGADPTIMMNPNLKSFAEGRPEQPWMTERQKYGFYHELVHAWHVSRGTMATGRHNDTRNSEWQVVGLGPYAKNPISENVIRSQMGKAPRPEYGLKTYD